MNQEQIPYLKELLKNVLKDEESIESTQIERLTAPGDNYGSLMLKLDIKLLNLKSGDNYFLHTVAKLFPQNVVIQNLFNSAVTFKNEIAFYTRIVPSLKNFTGRFGFENFFDIVPTFVAARINLSDTEANEVDHNAVLILENLKTLGYDTIERTKGFNIDITKAILQNMSKLHSAAIALKLLEPEIFKTEVQPFITDYCSDIVDLDPLIQTILIALENEPEELTSRAIKAFKKRSVKFVNESWGTISHNDMWVANCMVKIGDGALINVKFVDFQVCEYKSPCRDLLFFLFTSVELHTLKNNIQSFIDYYYDNFIQNLQTFGIDIGPFGRSEFDKELKLAANESEYFHIVWMLRPILKSREDAKDVTEFSMDDLKKKSDHLSSIHKERLLFITKEFGRREWI